MREIQYVGEKRRLLSDIFRCRNDIVTALDRDDKDGYNSDLAKFRRLVNALEEAI